MNREIKFRAKDLIHKKWIIGGLAQDRKGNYVILPKDDWSKGGCVDKETIGQLTGLHDRNQNPVYEGDILQIKEHVCFVKWNAEIGAWCISFELNGKEGVKPLGEWLCEYKVEVIGNIHDNKNLLEE